MKVATTIAVLCASSSLLASGRAYSASETASHVAAAKPAMALIHHRSTLGTHSYGSGFLISTDGLVLTCNHVVDPAPSETYAGNTGIGEKTWVRLQSSDTYEAQTIYQDRELDIAVLRIQESGYPHLQLTRVLPSQGDEVLVLGYPLGDALGKELAVTRGIVSAVRESGKILQVDAAVNAGNSGGPVIDSVGRVVGIAWAKIRGSEGLNLALSASTVLSSLDRISGGRGSESTRPQSVDSKHSSGAEGPPIDVFAAANPDAVVAMVNGDRITKKQLTDLLWGNQAHQVLDRYLITNTLVAQKAKEAGVTATDDEVQAKIEEVEKQNLGGTKTVDQALAEAGISKAAWVETSVKPQILAEKMMAKQVKVTDAELAEYIHARHILISTQKGEGTGAVQTKKETDARAKLDGIIADIKAGKIDFATAADQYSEDPSNTDSKTQKKKGGMLPWFKKGRMMKEFEEAVFNLSPGEISEPVKTFYGWHVIKLDKTGKDANPAEKEEVKKQIMDEKEAQAQGEFWRNIRTGAAVKDKLIVKTISGASGVLPLLPPWESMK